jgi:hypothetical protein
LPPLYSVLTRKASGEWVTFDEFVDPKIANEACAILNRSGRKRASS